jgi:hypothetical protein
MVTKLQPIDDDVREAARQLARDGATRQAVEYYTAVAGGDRAELARVVAKGELSEKQRDALEEQLAYRVRAVRDQRNRETAPGPKADITELRRRGVPAECPEGLLDTRAWAVSIVAAWDTPGQLCRYCFCTVRAGSLPLGARDALKELGVALPDPAEELVVPGPVLLDLAGRSFICRVEMPDGTSRGGETVPTSLGTPAFVSPAELARSVEWGRRRAEARRRRQTKPEELAARLEALEAGRRR